MARHATELHGTTKVKHSLAASGATVWQAAAAAAPGRMHASYEPRGTGSVKGRQILLEPVHLLAVLLVRGVRAQHDEVHTWEPEHMSHEPGA